MSPTPNGRLRDNDLVITRTFRAPIGDVWTSVTKSESTARWFGPWEPTPDDEKKIRIQMAFEEGKPWMDAAIEHCEAPHHLAVRSSHGWHLSMKLTEASGTTTLEFIHHGVNRKEMGEVGPGWEYYLDMLVASRDGTKLPTFDMFYPAQKEYFLSLA